MYAAFKIFKHENTASAKRKWLISDFQPVKTFNRCQESIFFASPPMRSLSRLLSERKMLMETLKWPLSEC